MPPARCRDMLLFSQRIPLWVSGLITTSVYFIYNIGCVFVNAGAMMKINVIFHCVVLDAELEISVINEMDERLLKIRHVNFKSFFFNVLKVLFLFFSFFLSGVSLFTALSP